MGKEMKFTVVDVAYSFDELEEHVREGILYDIMIDMDIGKSEAMRMIEDKVFNYEAIIYYEV